MKKLLRSVLILTATLVFSATLFVSTAFADSVHTEDDWDLTRAAVTYTEQGIEIDQTEMGIPDNHAIAILEVPFTDLNTFEIKFHVTMNDYVATGRQANDVWTAINIMGVPAFFNWRNSETYGWAKDTPGLVTRFLSYDGDLRVVTDVYQEGYKTAGDDASSQIVDTWTCITSSAGVSVEQDVTLKFAWEPSANDASKSFYSMYINGNKISSSDELAFVDREVLFPEDKLYLTVVMNTQEKAENMLSKVVIKEINGVSFVTATGNDGEDPGNSDGKESGCGSSVGSASLVLALFALGSFALLMKKREE